MLELENNYGTKILLDKKFNLEENSNPNSYLKIELENDYITKFSLNNYLYSYEVKNLLESLKKYIENEYKSQTNFKILETLLSIEFNDNYIIIRIPISNQIPEYFNIRIDEKYQIEELYEFLKED